MKRIKKESLKKVRSGKKKTAPLHRSVLDYHTELLHMKRTLDKLEDSLEKSEEKIQDMEIHVNLLTRLLTTLCIEKLGIRVGVLKRLIKRIEKEAIRDSQILHLEELYKMSPQTEKKDSAAQNPPPQPPSSKNDPWEDIS